MTQKVPDNKKISPSLVFFLIHAMQVGVGVLGFQRIIAKSAGYDAWISIIIAGLTVHIIVWMMYKMLKIADGDILAIHKYIVGKRFAKVLCSFFILYLVLQAMAILRNFIEIIQVWMFPHLHTFWFGLVFLLLVLYVVFGGFRTVTGVAFFSVLLPFYILFLFLYTVPYSDFTNMLPILDHSIKEILLSSRDMSFSIIGFESLLFFYPFIKNPEKSKKWAHLGIAYTNFAYLYLAIITFAYFPEAQLDKNIWPTLTLWKIIEMPFVERFEYIGIANWSLIILPNICIALWCVSRLTKQIYSVRQKRALPVLALLVLAGISLVVTREQINVITNITGKFGFYFNFAYVPILFIATLIAKKVKGHEKET